MRALRRVYSGILVSLAAAIPTIGGAQDKQLTVYNVIPWERGPLTADLGTTATVDIPDHCLFSDGKGAERFLRATENTPSGFESGIMLCTVPGKDSSAHWFVVFSFDKSGYVKDANSEKLDAVAILKDMREGQEQANEERRDNGYQELVLPGWSRAPHYDSLTNNLTWALRVRGKNESESDESINHSVRLLGRRGVMHADLVADPQDMGSAVPSFDSILTTFAYDADQSYAAWQPGDKVAKYGLTALVAGGAGLTAMKLGFFAKAWKSLLALLLAAKKLAIVVILAIGAFFKRIASFIRERMNRPTATADEPKRPVRPPVGSGRDPFKPVYPPGHPKHQPPAIQGALSENAGG